VRGYRLLLSPWLGSSCRFEPTCSVYALEALQRHGAAAGSYLAGGACCVATRGATAGSTRCRTARRRSAAS
jgi:putative component of membrane protein insertase Oxa1/YidC/SpoIIIJ protein YidD